MRSESNHRAVVVCAGGGIGDSLFASVVARALRQRYVGVDALALPFHRSALERVPDFDDVLIDDGTDDGLVSAQLASRGYAAAIITWATARTARIALRAGIPVRVGQARRLYSGWFTHRVTVRSEGGDVTSHWTQILLDYARALQCDTTDPKPRFEPTPVDEEQAERLLHDRGLGAKEFLIVHPFNAVASRVRWPLAGWARIARALRDRLGLAVVLTGGEQDADTARSLALETNTVSLAGGTGIGAFAAVAKRARAFVGISTGTMHLAAAVGCPTLGLFPLQSDFPERWAPLGDRTAVVRASFPCAARDTKEHCNAGYACIEHLDERGIVAAAEALLT